MLNRYFSLKLQFRWKKGKDVFEKKNAIKVLEIVGYPSSIISEAKRLAEELEQEKTQSRLE
jgi:DNA mismatch repair ATPase MutS